jgi:hypothetical protein
MVTVIETSKRTLSTSYEIAAYLEGKYTAMMAASPFKAGESVTIADRAGFPSDLGVGDVGVILMDVPGAWSHVLLLNAAGAEMVIQVASANLAKRDAVETADA